MTGPWRGDGRTVHGVACYYGRMRAIILSLGLLALTACTADPAAATPDPTVREQQILVPVTGADGNVTQMQTRLCRPISDAPARLVVINHGSPPDPAQRPRMRPGQCGQEAAQWFLARGYAVAMPLRRGYGATGGDYAEGNGPCRSVDFVHAGLETARDIDAAVDALTRLPFLRPDGVVIVGQSAGGWGAIAYDSLPHPKVAAFVVMAGGRGGHLNMRPNENCRPDLLAQGAAKFGATAATPMLWVYAENDSFFAPAIAEAMHRSFAAAGGKAEFIQPGPFGSDGHNLFFGRGGSAVWGPLVEQYLARQLTSRTASAPR